jgi:Flp pilus assembly protein TadD
MIGAQGRTPDFGPVRAFISENPKSLLARRAYNLESRYYSRQPKEEAAKFFADYVAAYPDDPEALASWLRKIVRDKGPMDKGAELASRLRALTYSDPNPAINLTVAQFYDLAGDKAKAEEVFGQAFMDDQIATNSRNLIAYANYWAGKKENLESALAAADAALKLQPDSVYTLRSVASVYSAAGEEAKALEVYGPAWLSKKIAQKSDQDLYAYAQFWTRQGKNLASALTAAKKAVELQPKAYFYWATLSDVCAKMNNKAEAVKAAERAVDLAEGNAKAAMQRKLDALKAPAPEKK